MVASVFLSTVLGICAESLNLVFQEEVLKFEVHTHNPPLLLLLPAAFVPACWAVGVARVSWQTWWWMASEETLAERSGCATGFGARPFRKQLFSSLLLLRPCVLIVVLNAIHTHTHTIQKEEVTPFCLGKWVKEKERKLTFSAGISCTVLSSRAGNFSPRSLSPPPRVFLSLSSSQDL